MKVLGISPLGKDATVTLVEDGEILFAAAEERFSRRKEHAGFPHQALSAALEATHTKPDDITKVVYTLLTQEQEIRLMRKSLAGGGRNGIDRGWRRSLRTAKQRRPANRANVPGLSEPNKRVSKGSMKSALYWWLGVAPVVSNWATRSVAADWLQKTSNDHIRWQQEIESSLHQHQLDGKLKRFEHHLSHTANAYYASGIERALVITLGGYGTGLAGCVSIGEAGKLKRLQNIEHPNSLATFYENVTNALGFCPDRHASKVAGLAAYGDPSVLSEVVLKRVNQGDGHYHLHQAQNHFFERYLASEFAMVDVAAAYQHTLEVVTTNLVDFWARKTGCSAVVLSGSVAANVKMNQRIFELPSVNQFFVSPNMGDGGCATGLALQESLDGGVRGAITDVYLGPGFSDSEMEYVLSAAGLSYQRPNNIAAEIASRIHAGKVVARFDGRMEYGPRALGNRSILFHATDQKTNQSLNERLGRTEFMPFSPVTTWEERHEYYENVAGAEQAAQFMTMTFDCTNKMKNNCPAAVHVDGTACPQLLKREINPVFYDTLREYEKLSGVPTLINTSFSLRDEPIVCSPQDAVEGFINGRLDVLAMGPFLVDPGHPLDRTTGRRASIPSVVSELELASDSCAAICQVHESHKQGEWEVRLSSFADLTELSTRWLDLQNRSAFSFFQSWSWIAAWLHTSANEADILLLECLRRGQVVGLAVLGHNTLRRHNVFTSDALLVTESGVAACDALTVEHSGLLIEQGLETDVIGRCLEFLRTSDLHWDEFYVSGVQKAQAQAYTDAVSTIPDLDCTVRAQHPYFFVDLEHIRSAGMTYLQTLSANTRYQINRSQRLYRARGGLTLTVADNLESAQSMFRSMKKLHQHSWYRRGYPGAFLSQYSNQFHSRLVNVGFELGQIQLVKIESAGTIIGYLYNFVLDGMVSNYQSAFCYENDSRFKPGLVSHAMVIQHNMEIGNRGYDLLMGDQRFKRSLTNHNDDMLSLVIRQSRLKFKVESKLKEIRNLFCKDQQH